MIMMMIIKELNERTNQPVCIIVLIPGSAHESEFLDRIFKKYSMWEKLREK